MTWRIYVDCSKPGKNTGWANANDGLLVSCGLWNNDFAPDSKDWAPTEKIVIEVPQINPNDLKKPGASARINDLMQLAICAGQWKQAVHALETRIVHPHEWKGSVKKEIHNARVLEKMTTAERALLPKLPASKLHNVIDAVGLFLWDTGRMRP